MLPYRSFFHLFGILHVIAGIALIFYPPALALLFLESAGQVPGLVAGYFAILAGIAFFGFAVIKTSEVRIYYLKLTAISMALGGILLALYAFLDKTPWLLFYIGGGVFLVLELALLLLYRHEKERGW